LVTGALPPGKGGKKFKIGVSKGVKRKRGGVSTQSPAKKKTHKHQMPGSGQAREKQNYSKKGKGGVGHRKETKKVQGKK